MFLFVISLLFDSLHPSHSKPYLSSSQPLPSAVIPIKFNWKTLSEKEWKPWYQPVDLCMLSQPENQSTYISWENCKQYSLDKRVQLFPKSTPTCGVGTTKRGFCPSPFHSREFYFQALEGFDNFLDQPLRDLIPLLHQRNQVLYFIGDSLTNQTFETFRCEALREGYQITESHIHQTNHRVYLLSNPSLTDPHDQNASVPIAIHYLFLSKLNHLWGTVKDFHQKAITNTLLTQGVFIVANIGMWYRDSAEYAYHTKLLLDWLQSLASSPSLTPSSPPNTVVFMESYPQHWDTTNGYYPTPGDNSSTPKPPLENPSASSPALCCTPLRRYDLSLDWRNRIIREHLSSPPSIPTTVTAASAQNKSWRVSILPIAEALAGAYNMHPCNPITKREECTHYCIWPMLLMFMWRTLTLLAKTDCVGSQCQL